MITTLSAFKEMIQTSSTGTSSLQSGGNPGVTNGTTGVAGAAEKVSTAPEGAAGDAVSVELSVSHDVFSAVDTFFNQGKSGRFDAFHALSPADKEQFVKIVAELAKSGYVGYEELIVNKKVERHDLTTQIGDRRLYGAKVYDDSKDPRR